MLCKVECNQLEDQGVFQLETSLELEAQEDQEGDLDRGRGR